MARDAHARFRRGAQLAIGLGARADPPWPRQPAATAELGERSERVLGRAVMREKLAEGDGTDILRADQPQPVPLVVSR